MGKKKERTIKTKLVVLIEGTEEHILNIKANESGEIDDDDYAKQEEKLMNKLEKKYPDYVSLQVVEIECEE